jgi:Autophagocytosis associated protein, active-site domain
MNSHLFRFELPQGSHSSGFALTLPDAPFPLLSQGEHPTTGRPCWYLHPCQTDIAVAELVEADSGSETPQHGRWMELWLMTVGAVVNL